MIIQDIFENRENYSLLDLIINLISVSHYKYKKKEYHVIVLSNYYITTLWDSFWHCHNENNLIMMVIYAEFTLIPIL